MMIIPVQQPAEPHYPVDMTARILAKIALSELKGGFREKIIEFVTLSVEDHTPLAVIAAKLHAMGTSPVLLAPNPAKSAAIIQNAASCAMSLAYHVPRTVPGLVHISDAVRYHVQCPVICYHAQSAVQRCCLVDINVPLFVGRFVQMFRIVRFVRTQQRREWSLILSCLQHSRRSILIKILALYHHVATS